MYCKKCGGKVESYSSHCPFCGEPIANNDVQSTYTAPSREIGGSNKSIGSWILTYIIMCIPLVGLIMLFVWAFGEGTKEDPTFRNWARAELVIMVIAFVLAMIAVFAMMGGLLGSLEDELLNLI